MIGRILTIILQLSIIIVIVIILTAIRREGEGKGDERGKTERLEWSGLGVILTLLLCSVAAHGKMIRIRKKNIYSIVHRSA